MRTFAAFTLIAALAACSADRDSKADRVSEDEAARLLINRNWLDLWPASKDERLHVYRFTPAMGGGVYQDRTLYRGTFELFTYEVKGDRIQFHLPDEDVRVSAKFRIRKIDGPEPFDLELTLDPTPRGPARYYGRTAETSAEWGLTQR